MPDDTTAPVAAEGLRERLGETLRKAFDYQIVAEWICCDPVNPDHELCARADVTRRQVAALLSDDPEFEPSEILDALLAALAGDPGDLPARMAEAIRKAAHDCDDDCDMTVCHANVMAATVSDGKIFDVEGTPEALAEVALSVRWEHAVQLAARLDHASGELSSRIEQHMRATTRAIAAEAELKQERHHFAQLGELYVHACRGANERKTVVAERDALKAAIERVSARHQPKQATQWIRCNRHAKALSTDVALFLRCTNCRKEPVTVCSNITCCEWPCEDRRAIDAALPALDAPETPESEADAVGCPRCRDSSRRKVPGYMCGECRTVYPALGHPWRRPEPETPGDAEEATDGD